MKRRFDNLTLDYMTSMFVHEPAGFDKVRERGETLRKGMQLSAYEGHLLRWLVRASGAKNVLEIGTFMGYSALWMASAPARITTIEVDSEHALLARDHFVASPYVDQVELLQGDALAWLREQPQEPKYDFLFIDAEKRRYPEYLELAMPLLTKHAWIVGDNTLLFGALTGEAPDAASDSAKEGMQKFNSILSDTMHFETMLLPTPEGMTVARRR